MPSSPNTPTAHSRGRTSDSHRFEHAVEASRSRSRTRNDAVSPLYSQIHSPHAPLSIRSLSSYHWSFYPATAALLTAIITTISNIVLQNTLLAIAGGVSIITSSVAVYYASILNVELNIDLLTKKFEDNTADLQKQISRLADEKTALESVTNTLRETNQESKAAAEQQQARDQQLINAGRSQIKELSQEISQLKALQSTEKIQYEKELTELTKREQQLKLQTQQSAQTNDVLNATLKQLQAEHAALKELQATLQLDYQTLNSEHQRYLNDNKSLKQTLAALQQHTSSPSPVAAAVAANTSRRNSNDSTRRSLLTDFQSIQLHPSRLPHMRSLSADPRCPRTNT